MRIARIAPVLLTAACLDGPFPPRWPAEMTGRLALASYSPQLSSPDRLTVTWLPEGTTRRYDLPGPGDVVSLSWGAGDTLCVLMRSSGPVTRHALSKLDVTTRGVQQVAEWQQGVVAASCSPDHGVAWLHSPDPGEVGPAALYVNGVQRVIADSLLALDLSWSGTGLLAATREALLLIGPAGAADTVHGVKGEPAPRGAAQSIDGRTAVARMLPAQGIWVVPSGGGAPARWTDGHWDALPVWSPDGSALLFIRLAHLILIRDGTEDRVGARDWYRDAAWGQ